MIANDSIIHRLRIPRECIYFPGSRHSKWIDCGLYPNNTCKRLTDRKGAQEGGMDARIICEKKWKFVLTLGVIWRLLAYPSYPGRANVSCISLKNMGNRLHEKRKVGSDRRFTLTRYQKWAGFKATRQWGLLAHPSSWANISPLWCSQLAWSTRSRLDTDNMRKHCWLGKSGQFFLTNTP